jgi:Tfp pilus assembly ATPase PilU
MRTARETHGSQTFDQHLVDLVAAGVVSHDAALTAAGNRGDVEQQIRALPRRAPQPADKKESAPAPILDDLSGILPGE